MEFERRWNEHLRREALRAQSWIQCQLCCQRFATSEKPQDGNNTTGIVFANFERHFSLFHDRSLSELGGEDQKKEFIQVQWEAAQPSANKGEFKPSLSGSEAGRRISKATTVGEDQKTRPTSPPSRSKAAISGVGLADRKGETPLPSTKPERSKSRSMSPPKRFKARLAGPPAGDDSLADVPSYHGSLWTDGDAFGSRGTYNKPEPNVTNNQRHRNFSTSVPNQHRSSHAVVARGQALLPTEEDDDATEIIKRPEARPISQEQLVAEVKAIYAGLALVESKCIEVDNNQSSQTDPVNKLNHVQWQALIALHRTLLHEHHDFFLASQHPSASLEPRRLAAKYDTLAHIDKRIAEIIRETVPSALRTSQKDQGLGRPGLKPTEIRDRRVCGVINGTQVKAIPDTGAGQSFISATFLKKLKRRQPTGEPEVVIREVKTSNAATTVQLASGKTVTSTSTVSIPWRFQGEENHTYQLECHVLPRCSQDLILGDRFLRLTKTLTTFKHRITTTLRSLGTATTKLFRLNYMGHDKRRLWGHLHGELVAALPDSGSDIMAISADYARRRGFHVDRGYGGRVMVQFADGSTAWTEGVVRGVEWGFGGGAKEKVACDFYVLEDLAVDVLFSSDFVFDYNVFGQHDGSLFRYDDGLLNVLDLCNIRLIGRYISGDMKPEEEGLFDVTSPDAFSPLMVQHELARRDATRELIAGLPATEQASAQQAEDERQRQWERWRVEHAQRWASAAASAAAAAPGPELLLEPASETDTAQSSQQVAAAANLGRTGRFVRAGRWAWKNCKVASIPLMPLRKRVSGSVGVVI